MLKVTPFILSLAIIICSGCGKSTEDVSGVYETDKIIPRADGRFYFSTQWTLDLSQSGKFTLKEDRSRVVVTENGEIRTPENGESVSGEWEMIGERIRLAWTKFIPPEATEQRDGQVNLILDLYIQENNDLVAELLDARWDDLGQNEFEKFDPDLYLIQTNYTVDGLRFVQQR